MNFRDAYTLRTRLYTLFPVEIWDRICAYLLMEDFKELRKLHAKEDLYMMQLSSDILGRSMFNWANRKCYFAIFNQFQKELLPDRLVQCLWQDLDCTDFKDFPQFAKDFRRWCLVKEEWTSAVVEFPNDVYSYVFGAKVEWINPFPKVQHDFLKSLPLQQNRKKHYYVSRIQQLKLMHTWSPSEMCWLDFYMEMLHYGVVRESMVSLMIQYMEQIFRCGWVSTEFLYSLQ